MRQTVKAVVLASESRRESDRLAWLLCDFGQVLRVYVRGARNGKNKLSAATEPFVMGSYDLYRTSGGYVVDEAEITEQFFALRADLKGYTLSGYFAQLILLLFTGEGEAQLYPLLTNCLYLLCQKKRDPALVKAVFEFRIAALAGYRPLLETCVGCKIKREPEEICALSIENGVGYCADCRETHPDCAAVGTACMRAIRAACGDDLRKALGFTLSGESLTNFCAIAEAYLLYRLEQKPPLLAYYQSLAEFEKQIGMKE